MTKTGICEPILHCLFDHTGALELMMETVFMKQKVNNEMEICEITDLDAKQLIEKALLKKRVSYYLKWPKAKFWSRRRVICILCVNENSRDEAEEAIKELGENVTDYVHFVARKSDNEFL